ncbi:histidine triad nucleotide-binding protein [Homoserinibacter sp. YIM 151385]|uniref:histidine triad nucleotide-binding protein n=1 Tax=Homoserinibacter sp. YIM 151385 TaxID=2985506 RepID=UPI0022F11B7C|nr:histidine triad nucleotide-binding protein [Homoserinibacter sp. YIM 151385]WBU38928.1 histidine triad nucleotide-binding protein [Homoserinibacter sp. YIM 151385]
MSSTPEPTVFERIAAREIPAEIVFESERVIAFRDIAPKAPVHLLVVPRTAEYRDVVELGAGDPALLQEIVATAAELAREHCDGQFRLIFNTGEAAGQTVFHVHAHVLGGTLPEGSLGTE